MKTKNKAEVAPAQSGQHTPLESELLEALNGLVWAVDGMTQREQCQFKVGAARDKARAAIAKAERGNA